MWPWCMPITETPLAFDGLSLELSRVYGPICRRPLQPLDALEAPPAPNIIEHIGQCLQNCNLTVAPVVVKWVEAVRVHAAVENVLRHRFLCLARFSAMPVWSVTIIFE